MWLILSVCVFYCWLCHTFHLCMLQISLKLQAPIRRTTNLGSFGTFFPDIPVHAQKMVGRWLIGCAGMVFGAVILGGVTRYYVD